MKLYHLGFYEQEKTLVQQYVLHRSKERNYPDEYMEKLAPYIQALYNDFAFTPNVDLWDDALVQKAAKFANIAHKAQRRKFIDTPYILHPLEVASRLTLIEGITPHELAAALLHDVVEDCGVSHDTINQQFGETVAKHLFYLTDIATPEDGNRSQRMEVNRVHLKLAPAITQNIKIVDVLTNTRSIVICDPNFTKTYVPELHIMRDSFNTTKDLPSMALAWFNQMDDLSLQVMDLQNQYNIVKIDKKKPNSSLLKNPQL